MTTSLRRAALVGFACLALTIGGVGTSTGRTEPSDFARQVDQLSEPGGEFDTDNLISNETSYLRVVPDLAALGVQGGAYIGVGPDQNFSYIAQVRPSVAYVVDIRRDNLLLHLLFKALFDLAPTRIEYLCLLTGRPVPEHVRSWTEAPVDRMAGYLDATQADRAIIPNLRRQIEAAVSRTGVAVSRDELEKIARFHETFVKEGLGLRFNTFGRRPQFYYPTFRDLIQAADAEGRQWSYLASDADYQFVRALEHRYLIIPVTGDLSGPHAMRAIADDIGRRGEHVSAFYVSNVENYLFRDGRFARFVENLTRLPRNSRSVVIRSIFGGGPSVSVVQPLDSMVADHDAGRYRTYSDLVGASSHGRGIAR